MKNFFSILHSLRVAKSSWILQRIVLLQLSQLADKFPLPFWKGLRKTLRKDLMGEKWLLLWPTASTVNLGTFLYLQHHRFLSSCISPSAENADISGLN